MTAAHDVVAEASPGTASSGVDPSERQLVSGLVKTLDKLSNGGHPGGSPREAAIGDKARDPQGRFTNGKVEGADTATDPADPAQAVAAKPPALSDAEQADYEKARGTLRRHKVPQDVLDARDPKTLIAWAKEIEPLHRQQDEHARQLGELQKEKETWQKSKESEALKQSGQAEQPIDFKALVQPFSEELSSKGVEALASFAQKLFETAVAHAESKFQSALGGLQLDRIGGSVARMELREAKAELEARHPLLKEAGKWDLVDKKAAELAQRYPKGTFPDFATLYNEAASIALVNELHTASTNGMTQEHRERDNGAPAKPRGVLPKTALTPEQEERAVLSKIMQEHGFHAPKR